MSLPRKESFYKKHGNCKNKNSQDTSIHALMNRYKQKAKIRKLVWNINEEKFRELISQNCYYCGVIPLNRYNAYISKSGTYRQNTIGTEWSESAWILYNGLDRVDNFIGYETTNIVPCCMTCNFAKRNLSQLEFINWLKCVAKNIDNINKI